MDENKSVGKMVKSLSNQLRRLMDQEVLKEYADHISGMQLWAAGFIYQKSQDGDVFQKDIEKGFKIRRSTATRMLQAMEKNGLIRREPVSSDARIKKIVYTDKTERINKIISERISMVECQLTKGISEKEVDLFFRIAEKMSNNLDEIMKG